MLFHKLIIAFSRITIIMQDNFPNTLSLIAYDFIRIQFSTFYIAIDVIINSICHNVNGKKNVQLLFLLFVSITRTCSISKGISLKRFVIKLAKCYELSINSIESVLLKMNRVPCLCTAQSVFRLRSCPCPCSSYCLVVCGMDFKCANESLPKFLISFIFSSLSFNTANR